MSVNKSVCAVIVTYNRKEYLLSLLQALSVQTYKLCGILVFDNHSSDGTDVRLVEEGFVSSCEENVLHTGIVENTPLFYYRNSENTGGSGGFHDGMKLALNMGTDYLWVMDDDVLPEPDCLERLVQFSDENAKICIPNRTDERFQDRAITSIDKKNPFCRFRRLKTSMLDTDIPGQYTEVCDMPFEGPLIATTLIHEIGLPKKELFILFDDTEFAQRAVRVTRIRFVKGATLHRQIVATIKESQQMGWKDYYYHRNQFYFYETYGENIWVRYLRPRIGILKMYIRSIARGKWSNFAVLHAAYRDGTKGILGKTVEPTNPFCYNKKK